MSEIGGTEQGIGGVQPNEQGRGHIKRDFLKYGDNSYAVGYKGKGPIDIGAEDSRYNGGVAKGIYRLTGETGKRFTVNEAFGTMMIQDRRDGKPIGEPTFQDFEDEPREITLGEPCPWLPGNERVTGMVLFAQNRQYLPPDSPSTPLQDYTKFKNPLEAEADKIREYREAHPIPE